MACMPVSERQNKILKPKSLNQHKLSLLTRHDEVQRALCLHGPDEHAQTEARKFLDGHARRGHGLACELTSE